MPVKNFWYWNKLYNKETSGQLRFLPLVLAYGKAGDGIRSQPTSLQLTLQGQRFRIEIGENFSPSALKGLILTLEQL